MKWILIGSGMMALALLSGCATNVVSGTGSVVNNEFFHDVGVWGNDNQITVRRGSRVYKLSILGHSNTITVEDDVTLNRIEFAGRDNVVNVPDNLIFRVTGLAGNQLIRRPAERRPVEDYMPGEIFPPTDTSSVPPTESGASPPAGAGPGVGGSGSNPSPPPSTPERRDTMQPESPSRSAPPPATGTEPPPK